MTMPQKIFEIVGFLVAIVFFMVGGNAYAATPTVTLTNTTGDQVQLVINGDPNMGATLRYNIGGASGDSLASLGITDSNGALTTTISSIAYGINPASQVYVLVNGQQSTTQTWPYGASTNTTNTSGNTGTVNASAITFSPSILTINKGQAITVKLSGGSGYYISGTTSASVATQSVSGSMLTINGLSDGSTVISLCSVTPNVCGSLTAAVGNTNATTATTTAATVTNPNITFSVSNPTLTVGQTLNVALAGGSEKFRLENSPNPNLVQASVGNNVLSLTALGAGSTFVTVCDPLNSNRCGTLFFSITNAAPGTTVQTTLPVTTPATTSPAPSAPAAPILQSTTTTAANIASTAEILVEIKTLQTKLTQMLSELQAMQGTLQALVSKVAGSLSAVKPSTSAASTAAISGGKHKFNSSLSIGSKGEDVTALQQRLTAEGYYSEEVTGFFGSLTKQAVIKYQKAKGLTQSGTVDASTRAALNAQ
ncbi:MAG: peptidoglycan-binding protein [Candidatus Liptonbacteria bacterium]|nr:peptidoglycan-binding protein [Candidatus Liptonbacteria bacterium]